MKPTSKTLRPTDTSRKRIVWVGLMVLGLATSSAWVLRSGWGRAAIQDSSDAVPNPQLGQETHDLGTRLLRERRRLVLGNQDSVVAWLDYAYALDAAAAWEEAAYCYRKVLSLESGNLPARYNLAYTLYRLGETEEALAAFRSLAQELPTDVPVQLRLGEVLESAGELGQAEAAYTKAVELDPDSPTAQRQLGQILLRSGKETAAIAHLERADRLLDRDRSTVLALARAYQIAGRASEAEARNADALTMPEIERRRDRFRDPILLLEPASHRARQNAQSAFQTGRFRQSLDDFLLVVSVWPDEAWAHLGLSKAYSGAGDEDRAKEQLDQYQALQGRSTEDVETASP